MASRKRRRSGTLIFIVTLAVLCLCYAVISHDRPFLGLDLQGGVSVVLKPQDPTVSTDSLNEAKQIINRRINGLGVAEANVTLQGNTILVEIPGVKDPDRALALIGQTAQLQFRPVLAEYPVSTANTNTTGTDTTGTDNGTSVPPVDPSQSTSTSQQGLAPTGEARYPVGESAAGLQTTGPASTVTTAAPTTTAAPSASTSTLDPAAQAALQQQLQAQAAGQTGTAPPLTSEADLAKPESKSQVVVLPQVNRKTGETTAIFQLGPVLVDGTALSGASASIDDAGQWQVNPTFKDGKDGIDAFNAAAAQCFAGNTTCPNISGNSTSHGQLAVVLDNEVLTAPSIDAASFTKDQIKISGSFDQKSANDVALALRYGALPVVLDPQQSQLVSATLGADALHAGLVAGFVGFILVGIYMIAFYRLLGVLAMLKLFIEASILTALLCYMGAHMNLALTLAGITGIIVSIGVSLDSNVVYYEHLKEDIRAGRTVRAAVDQSFVSAWKTIVAADGASVIGAGLLWFLTIGAVRGFALFLGISTLLDLLTSYCYMRPVVRWATTSKRCAEHPHQFGLPESPVAPTPKTEKVPV